MIDNKDLYELSKKIHRDNILKGFYDTEIYDNKTSIILKQLLLIITEISEAVEEYRNNGIDTSSTPFTPDSLLIDNDWINTFKTMFKDRFQDEIADTLIRIFDLLGYLDINIYPWIVAKIEFNKSREMKHGKRF